MPTTTLYANKDLYWDDFSLGSGTTNFLRVGHTYWYDEDERYDGGQGSLIGFDLSGITTIINSAKLRIYANVVQGWEGGTWGGYVWHVSGISSSWSESPYNISYYVDLPVGVVSTFDTPALNAWTEIDVTSILQAQKLYGGTGFKIWRDLEPDDESWSDVKFYSREDPSNLGPQLVVDYTVNTAPNAPTLSTPISSGNYNTRRPSFAWTFSDPDGGDSQSAFQIQVSTDNTFSSVNGWDTGKVASGSGSYTPGSDLADSLWYYRIRTWDQYDANGPWSSAVPFRVDLTAPVIGSVQGTSAVNTSSTFRVWAYNVTDSGSGINRVQFPSSNITTSGGATWIWFDGTKDGASNNWYCDIPLSSFSGAEGMYYSDVYAYDNASNLGTVQRITTYIDRTAPTIASSSGYSYTNATSGTRRVWAYGVSDSLSGVVGVNAAYTPPGGSATPVTAYASGSDFYVDISLSSTQGEWTVSFTAVDNAGNMSGTATSKFFIDSQLANDPAPSAVWQQTTATIYWIGFSDPTPSSGYKDTKLWLGEWNGSDWVGGVPNKYNGTVVTTNPLTLEQAVTGLAVGKRYQYTVAHYDNAGNQSAYTWYEFVTKKQIGSIKMRKSGQTLTLPVYDPASGVLGSKVLRVATSSGVGCFEFVSTMDAAASPLRVSTSAGIKSVAKA